MPPFSTRGRGLLLAALCTICLILWLVPNQSLARGVAQDSPFSPPEQPTATETPTDTPFPDVVPTDTPFPDTPTPEIPPTDTPVAEAPTPEPPPTETPIPDTPTPDIPTPTPTETPTPEPTIRAILLPTATPELTLFSVAGQVIEATLTSAVWIWLTCGSLLFFAVAGTIAGFSFYRQSRQRFDLYEIVPEEESQPTRHRKEAQGNQPPDEDSWPSSLP